jgi:folate-dependent phosphoribosylglycinamide formyltransferase PurN
MRILVLVQDEPFFLKRHLPFFLKKNNVIAVVLLSQRLPNESYLKYICRYFKLLGFFDFVKMALIVIFKNFFEKDLESKLKKLGIPVYKKININSPEFVDTLKSLKPNLGISIASPQIISNDILNFFDHGFINLHGGYLPDFPGVFTPFWNLLKNSTHAGCTVHEVCSKIDGGRIINRLKFPIGRDDSMMKIYEEITRKGIELLEISINQIENNNIKYIKNKYSKDNYNTFPTFRDGKHFRDKGLKIF